MIKVNLACDRCVNKLPNIDGWKCVCKAFPEGTPMDYLIEKVNVRALNECNNGYRFVDKKKIVVGGESQTCAPDTKG